MTVKRARLLFLSTWLGLAAASAAPVARAQDAQTQAMGRALFNEGVALFNAGKYAEACPKLEASLRHYPGIGTRGKLAECYERLGKTASAWVAYREVARLSAQSGDAVREQVASQRARALEPRLSYVTVAVAPASDVPGLVVERSGVPIGHDRFGNAEPTDPGTLHFEVRAPGRRPLRADLVVTPGKSARFDVPALEPLEDEAGPRVAGAEPAQEGRAWQRPAGLVIGGIGIAGLAVGGIFGLAARSTYEGAFDDGRCDRATKQCDAAGQDAIGDARSQATLSTVLFAGGAALAIGGAVLWFTAPKVRVAPAALAGGGGVVVGGAL